MCSRSMLVTTARIGESFRNERSLSSASATRYCDLPRRALEPMASTRPPTTTVGSRPPAASTAATMLVVVVFPCMPDGDPVLEPHQLGEHLRALDYGNVLVASRCDFGIVAADGGAGHYDFRSGHVFRAVPLKNDGAQLAQPLRDRRRLEIRSG